MVTHRGFTAWISSNGEPLPEYLIAVDERSHCVSCWIPGTEGHRFVVYWQDHGGHVDSCGFITLDGLVVPGKFLYGQGITSRGGVRASKSTERPFMFQKVPEIATESPHRTAAKEAGMITLKIKRIKRVVNRPPDGIQPLPAPAVLGKRQVGDLCIGFGEEVQTFEQHASTWSVVPYDQDVPGATKPSTYVSFVFRYRSPDFLEDQGISVGDKPTPKKSSTHRLAGLPPHVLSGLEPSPSPHKKRRLMPLLPHPDSSGPRRPSSEMRRTMSWTVRQKGLFEGQSQFLLPRNVSAPIMAKPHIPSSADTSEGSETDAT
ncbi:hypothetical protein BYT27DRAFT_7203868 [Phlegmacium glaucopus]|nr:hypothetical protein BYT27DRAFT_7203868 [Phlegmacium glaucopus]